MSIVVAVQKGRRIVMASDSLSSCGSHKDLPDNAVCTKIRRVGNALIGVTGWSLYENILNDLLASGRTPRLTNKESIFKFCLRLWRVLHDKYSLVNDQSTDKQTPFGDIDAQLLVANKHGIFSVASNLTVSEFKKYYAIGSGSDYAFGALHCLYDTERNPGKIAEKAVETGIQFDSYCGGKIDLFEIKK